MSDLKMEDFVRLYSMHESKVRAYVRAGLPTIEDVNEVMQEVSLVAWRKFSTLEDAEGFGRWMCVIARYEILKYRRSKARDRLVLDEDLLSLIADEGVEETSERAAEIQALQKCIRKLPEKYRGLVIKAYTPDQSKKKLAAEIGKTPAALYQLLSRLRLTLLNCVQGKLANEGIK
ncbi:sigma-70 family RNA polymerase sigma factor [Coraliomargarita sp. SDUM461003]|uniref:Sigma-70 family RNA polymerase sigma factor n=2 Tax=Coraliomargaritaceae TaxID=3056371 RepID=A0ABU1AWC3_9BACT|nr:sigma-70 family RNA polymerase sigma factor [Coraliomargarita sp. SDUM461003]MDQ8207932.1 sigma-70 family RNA polymerase sigma factor [Coraliomargarita sp. SDUM461003]